MFKDNNSMIQQENIDNIVYDGIGHNGIRYIQESGQKIAGKIYLDKNQPGLWYCLTTNNDINNTLNFTRGDNIAIFDKLQNLPKIKSLTIDIASGALDSSKKREQKTFNISTLNIEPICVFPYVPSSSSEAGGVYLEHVNIVSFNNNTITVDFDYAGQYAIGIEAKAIILYYE